MELPTKLILLVLQFILISFLPKTSAQFQFLYSKCGNINYYTQNSTYQSNLKTALNSLSSTPRVTNGYYNFTAGQTPNKVKAMVLCRGDVPYNTCRLCIRDSAATLPVSCPNQTEAFGYTDNCIIFYSNNFSFNAVKERPRWALWNNKNVSNITGFNNTLTSMMNTLQNKASLGNSELKSAAAQINLTTTNQTMYGLVQCNPDLSRFDCVKCVQYLIFSFFSKDFVTPTFIAAGARVITPSCNLRYEIYSFYGNLTDVGPPPPPVPVSNRSSTPQVEINQKSHRSHSTIVIVIPIMGSLVLIISIASICILLRRKKRKKSATNLNKEEIENFNSLQYSFEAIKVATNDFSNDNYLGEGAFGAVYKFQFTYSKCGNITYTPNSTYQTNLQTVLKSISSDTRSTKGYYNFTAGRSPNKVEAMVVCRADVPVNTCRLCMRDSAANLPTNITGTNETVYGLVQCSPDLSRLDCVACVQYIIFSYFPTWLVKPTFISAGTRVLSPSCNLRYEIYPFHVGPLPGPPPPPQLQASNTSTTAQVEKGNKSHRAILVIIPIIGSLSLIIVIATIYTLQRKKQKKSAKDLNKDEIETLQSLQYSLGTIKDPVRTQKTLQVLNTFSALLIQEPCQQIPSKREELLHQETAQSPSSVITPRRSPKARKQYYLKMVNQSSQTADSNQLTRLPSLLSSQEQHKDESHSSA
ncbi:hypothetical protein SOVF_129730 [Spinacia oleracea]|nr:hypothetical protein SOVF_129730 [Spinacia oleracea]